MNKKERFSIAKEFSNKILEKYGKLIRSIIIFGSSARGDFNEHSDIDIAIIYNNTINICGDHIRNDMIKIASNMQKKVDVFVWNYKRFKELIDLGHPLMITLVEDGKTLYGEKIIEKFKGKIKPSPKLLLDFKFRSDELEKKMIKNIIVNVYSSIFRLLYLICIQQGIKICSPKRLVKTEIKKLKLTKSNEIFIKKILKLRRSIKKESLYKNITTYEIIQIIRNYKKLKEILKNKLIF